MEAKMPTVDASKIRVPSTPNPTPNLAGKAKSFLAAAILYLVFGFKVYPVTPGQKKPAVPKLGDWLKDLSEEKVRGHYSRNPSHEVGILVPDDCMVLDTDSEEAEANLKRIFASRCITPNYVVKTAKGYHYYLKLADGVHAPHRTFSSEDHPGKIDVLGGGRMVIAPPSTGKTLVRCDARSIDEITTVDQCFVDSVFLCNGDPAPRPSEPRPERDDNPIGDSDIGQLEKVLSFIDPDMGYDDWTRVGMAVYHGTGGNDEGLDLYDSWSSTGTKYKNRREIETKWKSFRSDVANPVTVGTLVHLAKADGASQADIANIFDHGFEAFETEGVYIEDDALSTIQRKFALIKMDGRVCMVERDSLNELNEQGVAKKLELSNLSDSRLLITRALKAGFPKVETSAIVSEFLVNPQTVLYDGVEFNPKGTSRNYLNLWIDPTIIPRVGNWPLIEAFLREVICAGNSEAYEYLIRYIAHALQHPEEKPGVMVIMVGGQGVGKGTLGRILQKIWGATYIQINNIDNITGSFNAVLERSFIVFLDEALFAGNRRASDALKSLVTEPTIQVNEKYQPSRQTRSYHRFIAATNASHFKNTERDDRRDFTLRVSDAKKGDFEYWGKLNHEIENGGVEAMAHDLLQMDLTGFNVRSKPNTGELLEQKLMSLDPIPRWWHDYLLEGGMGDNKGWPDFISTSTIIAGIVEIAGNRLYQKPSGLTVSNEMAKLCPSAEKAQRKERFERARGYSLPPLEQARAEFEAYIGGPVKWD